MITPPMFTSRERIATALWWSAAVGSWLVALFAATGTRGPASALAVALTPAATLLVLAVVIVAAASHRWLLVAVAIGVLTWSVVVAGGVTSAANAEPHPSEVAARSRAGRDATVDLVSSNVRSGNASIPDLVDAMQREEPDVIAFQEIGRDELAAIRRTDLRATYPHEIADPRPGFHGGAVFSRWPLTGSVEDIGGFPMIVVTVDAPTGAFHLIDVHVAAPLSRAGHEVWTDQLRELGRRLDAATAPTVLIGDFNATPHHRELRQLAVVGTADGLGAFPSYPTTIGFPFLALDHVFSSGGACIQDVRPTDANPGSDHRGLRASVSTNYSPTMACR